MTPHESAEADGQKLFEAVSAAFGSLGRACMALDAEFRVVHVSALLDQLAGGSVWAAARGEPVERLLGEELFGAQGRLRQALEQGERREGWRGLLTTPAGTRAVSLSACRLLTTPSGPCAPGVEYLVVMRPAEDEGPGAGIGLAGRSRSMDHVAKLLESLRDSEATVLIEGESGTGKEVLARLIHQQSHRAKGPFVAVAPAALPEELIESELFGHVKGAFTGAMRDRIGRFEMANDGTLFLDELGELPLHLQVKLLRVLQEKSFERVGAGVPRKTNARIIAATNRDLKREIAAGRFREDLYYRLRVVPIEVPALRARREDIEPIARQLLSRAGARSGRSLFLSPEALRLLLSYAWPGNVRELENALEFATVVCRGQTIHSEDLPPELRAPRVEVPVSLVPAHALDERAELLRLLQVHSWRRAAVAEALGISRSTLWRRMQRLGVTS